MTTGIRSTSRATGLARRSTALFRAVLLACLCTWTGANAQERSATTLNFRDVDLAQVVEVVATITGKPIILDPRVRANVTIISPTALPPDQVYETFLSLLQVHGFVAVPSGNVIKIVPDANARQYPANDLPDRIDPNSDELVTQVVPVRNINATQLVPILRPLMPQYAHLVASQAGNALILSDRASNVSRIMRIIQRIDQAGDEEIDVVRLENATAGEIVRVMNALFQGQGQPQEIPGNQVRVVADERTNSVLISGERSQRLRYKALIAHLDTPGPSGGDTQVRYLNYADAEALAAKLKEQVQGFVAAAGGAPGAPGAPGASAAADRSTTIWADPQMNALVITAPPKIMRQIMQVVDRLDVRRAQVLIEAILVEVSSTRAAELGVNWAIGSREEGSTVPIGTFNQPVGGASIGSIISAASDPDLLTEIGLPTGLTLGAGRLRDTGVSFAMLLRALRGDSSTNILQTPSIMTLDNEEAEIKVAQEVPFITGQFANTGASTTTPSGIVNPFQTIQREEVGEILKITPQINEGDAVILKIEQESSGVTQGPQGAVDLVTNKRTISTKVLVEDGGIIVLGGLISDSAREGESRVPVLGSIPIIGELFKTRSGSKEKRNLMIFIRPTIIRDGISAAIETNAKYNVIRNQQLSRRRGRVTLLPGERQPLLPPIEELSKYADPTAGAQPPTQEELKPPVQTAPLPETQPPRETPDPSAPDVPPPASPGELRPRAQ
jgi:general secretion pathway protein D